MKILRIRLKNYRGVDACEIKPSPNGITVIQGPNEIGKSSLVEAVRVLFEHLDSSSKRELQSLKPVHKDAGPEIEVDIESGPYAFTYSKRFLKRPETVLRISRPNPESLTGREAHERVEMILAETLDLDLWKALSIRQGTGIEQVDLGNRRSLSAALDRAAGGSQGGAEEETLFDQVREEYALYYSERGEKKILADAGQAVSSLRQEVQTLEADLKAIDKDVERSEALVGEIAKLIQAEAEQAETSKTHQERWHMVSGLKAELEHQEALLGKAVAEAVAARKDVQERERLRKVLEEARAQRQRFLDEIEASAPDLRRAQEAHDEASRALADAKEAYERADRLARLRKADHEWRRNELDLTLLEERKKRIDQAIAQARKAQEILDKTLITDPLLKKIQEAHVTARVAKGQLEAGSPSLRIEALTDIAAKIDGKKVKLKVGESREQPVADKLNLLIPEVARLEISPGTGANELAEAFGKAEADFAELLKKAGVRDLAEAEQANHQRLEAKRCCAAKDDAVRENLRDLAQEEMLRRINLLSDQVERYAKDRRADPPPAKLLEKARDLAEKAEAALADVTATLKRAEKSEERARKRLENLRERTQASKAKCEVIESALAAHEQALAKARAQETDEHLAQRHDLLFQKAQHLEGQVVEARRRLAAEDPDRAQHLSENATAVLAKTSKELRERQDLQIAVNSRLEQEGARGLWEMLQDARARLARAEQEQALLSVRATAAKLLFETMAAEREQARARYVAPLRERIQRLGHDVFGESFSVELDDDLAVANCTREGRTVPFKDLSVGAQEQIGLITRLSCALLVSKEGGPLILDDALGYTDPKRLEAMGAVLALAGRETQVIVLTCMPERYRHVGEANVVRLDGETVNAMTTAGQS